MTVFVRAVVTGFGFSLGAALFRKVSDRLGLNDDKSAKNGRQDSKVDPDVVAGKAGGESGADDGHAALVFG
ncbi:MAG TPA: hypothetical protein VK698_35835 [Kofleriaceae bacterium]|nr:hypothetical protein [Kofleriaceae bacterium]